MSTPPDALRDALAQGRGGLILGPEYGRTHPALAPERLDAALLATSGEPADWAELSPLARLELAAAESVARLEDRLTAELPWVGALRGQLRPLDRALASLPVRTVVDAGLPELFRAAWEATGRPFAVVGAGDPEPSAAERWLVRLRGDLWLGPSRLTRAALQALVEQAPAAGALGERVQGGPVLALGFAPQDELLPWIRDALLDQAPVTVLAVGWSALWRRLHQSRGLEVLPFKTEEERDAWVEALAESVSGGPDAELAALDARLRAQVDAFLSAHPQARPAVLALGLPLPLKRLLRAIEATPASARARLEEADALLSSGATATAEERLGLGEAWINLGAPERAVVHLEAALTSPEQSQAGEALSRLAQCTLERLQALKAKGRNRAAVEALGAFLAQSAPHFGLLETPPKDALAVRALYFANLRMGRIMAQAAELSRASAGVYGGHALTLLERAATLAPDEPAPYRALMSLLGPGSYVADPTRLAKLMSRAPEAARRKP